MTVETRLASLVPHGHLHIADDPVSAANAQGVEKHFEAEWHDDLDAIMATLVPDDPYQYVPSLGMRVRGSDAVRAFYQKRIQTWPGQAFRMADVLVGPHVALFEGTWTVQPRSEFLGLAANGHKVSVPGVISIEFRDGLLVGETLYFDSADMSHQLLHGSEDHATDS